MKTKFHKFTFSIYESLIARKCTSNSLNPGGVNSNWGNILCISNIQNKLSRYLLRKIPTRGWNKKKIKQIIFTFTTRFLRRNAVCEQIFEGNIRGNTFHELSTSLRHISEDIAFLPRTHRRTYAQAANLQVDAYNLRIQIWPHDGANWSYEGDPRQTTAGTRTKNTHARTFQVDRDRVRADVREGSARRRAPFREIPKKSCGEEGPAFAQDSPSGILRPRGPRYIRAVDGERYPGLFSSVRSPSGPT